jgi:phosphatidylglycerol:prolipoprotein diacylglycerol transferase
VFRSPGPIALAFRLPADLPFVGGLSVSIRWYGVLIASSMALGLWLATREAARRGESADDLLKAAELALIGGLVGARLYYVLFNLDYYQTQPWWRIFAVWEGGLAIHGGLIGGLLTGGAYVWAKGLPLLTYLDIVAPSLLLGQAIGRWGNFFNEEAFGGPTDLPWKLYISEPRRPPAFVDHQFFHPTFLYESLWNFGAFLLLYFVLRTDSLMLGSMRVAQLVSVVAVAVAAIGIPILMRRRAA